MTMHSYRGWGMALLAAMLNLPAWADESKHKSGPLLPKYQQECAACHVAYPPRLLPAASWQAIMGNLSHHYGTDASLDPAVVQELSAWLASAASTRVQERPPEDRITRSAWFLREHREVPASAWKHPAVRKGAQCAACHTRANEGDFNERYITIPR